MTNKDFIEERIRLIDEAIKYEKSFIHDRYDSEGVKRLLEQKKQFESIKNELEILEIFRKSKKDYVGIPPTYDDKELTITIKKDNWNKIKEFYNDK